MTRKFILPLLIAAFCMGCHSQKQEQQPASPSPTPSPGITVTATPPVVPTATQEPTSVYQKWNLDPRIYQLKEKVYVSEKFKALISIVDPSSNTIIANLPPRMAIAQAFAFSNDYTYFISSPSVDIFNKDLMQIGSVDFDGFLNPGLTRVAVTHDDKKMYIGVIGWGRADRSGIFVLEPRNRSFKGILLENEINTGMLSLSSDEQYLVVPKIDGLGIVSVRDDSLIKTIPLDPGQKICDTTTDENNRAYYSTYSENTNGPFSIVALNLNDFTQQKILTPNKIYRLAVRGNNLYAAAIDVLMKFDSNSGTLIKTISISCDFMAISGDGSKLFATSTYTGEVIVVDLANDNVISKINIGGKPYAIHCH